jgi:hypothetical protein
MNASAPATTAEKTAEPRYVDPVVAAFYATVISALEEGPDGASMATVIAGEFQRHHHTWVTSNAALHSDVRRLTADDHCKAAMLSHASKLARRVMEEHMATVGQLHGHQTVESRLHELARQLDESAPGTADEIRDILTDVQPSVIEAPVRVVLSHVTDARWTTGWFRRTDRRDGPLQPLPFAGWVLVADDHQSAAQCVQAAFLHGSSWYTKVELAERGMNLERID